jgi:hypothetical protein
MPAREDFRSWNLELSSSSSAQLGFAALARAIRTAKNLPADRFHPVTNDLAAAMIAFRRDHRDSALEAVKNVGFALRPDLKSFVVLVSA